MSLLTKKQAGTHENASTQINVPKDVADQIIAIGKELIPDEHLAGEGRVMQPHVTVKYGVQPDEGALQQALAGRTSFPVSLGNTVAFTNSNNNAGGTPIVVEVHGHELEALHDAVMQAMGTLPDDLPYVPHITIAYLKPDEAQHYVGSDAFTGIKFTAHAVALSPYDDSKQVEVPLGTSEDVQRFEQTAASPAQVTPEIPQVRPQTPQQQEPEEDEEVQRDEPATPEQKQQPQQKQPKAPLLKKQPKPKAPKPPAKNPDFKKWFGKSKVTDSSGKPLVVYHGTTHDFTTFDPSKTTKDSFYGQGLYFTSSKKDLENYANDKGPDLTRRVEFQSERLMQEWEDSWDDVKDQLGMSQLEEFPAWGTYGRDELNEKAKQEAKKEIAGGSGGMSMPVYLSLQNPVIVQKRGGTEFHIDMEEDENGEYTGEESGTGVDLYNAMMRVQGSYESADAQDIWNDLIGNSGGDFTAYDFEQQVRNGNHEITDDNGDMVMGSFIADIYRELGFDGIIQDAYAEFGPRPSGYAGGKLPGMTMDQDTKHYILWDSSKIKSALGNVGKYDPQNPSIIAAYEDEEIEEYTPESWEEKWTLQPGTTLYHGSSNEWEEGSELAFPAWFSTNKKVANWFAHRNGEGTPIIRTYRVSNPYELVVLNDARDIQGFRDMYNIEDGGDPNALAEGVIGAGFEGWIIPNNYRPGDDIMLGDGSGIQYLEQHPADAKSSDFFATGSVLAANTKSVGDLGLAKRIVHEMMPIIGAELPEPELKIVNQPRANWLGRDTWRTGYERGLGNWSWGSTTTIELQRSILNDENTLRRIIAHELCHHAGALTTQTQGIQEAKARGTGEWGYKNFIRNMQGTGHGAEFKKWAAKFNAKYGADFVTEKSDESYAVEELELKPYHILLKRDYDGKLAYEVSSRISPKMKRQLDRMASEKEGTEYRLTQTNDRRFFEGNLIGSFYWSRSKDENVQVTLEELWAKAQKILPTGAATEQDELLKLMREKMTGPGWQRPGRASLFQKNAIPQIEPLEHGVSKDYDRVAYVYNQMYSNRTPSLSWKDFQKTFPREQNSPLFTQIRQNRPQITLADLDRWLEEYKEKAKEYQNYELEHDTYKDKATSFRDVEQLVLKINQSASAAEIIGEDPMMKEFLGQLPAAAERSGHPSGKNLVGWLRVDFINDEWLLIDEVQSDLINAVDLAKRFIIEPNLEALMSKYKSETVKQKIRDMGANEQMFQASKREFARRGYTIEKLEEMKRSLANLFKDWAEYGISSIIEIARRHGIKNVAIHTGSTIAQRDPDLEADKAGMYYDQIAKGFGFRKQQLDVGDLKGEFWTRTASKTAGKRDEAVTSLTFGVDILNFPSPVLVRWEPGMRWREVLKAVKAIAGEVAEKRIPWGDIHIWASLWENRQAQEEGWESQKAKGRVMYDVLHNGSYVRVDNAAQPVAMGAEEIPTDQPPTEINGVPVYASHKTPPLSDTRYENPAQGEETNAYADIPERVKGVEELPSLEELAPQMFDKEGGAAGPTPEGVTYRTDVRDSYRDEVFARAEAWLNDEMIGKVDFNVVEMDTELDDTRYWREQLDEYGSKEWERIAEIPQQAWVKYVYVKPEFRRMGIATGMYEQIKKDFPGVKLTSSGTTEEGGKMRRKMEERGMFASILLQKKAVYGEAQNQVQHTDHTPVGMYKVLKSNPFADEMEALRLSEGEEAPELNPVLPGTEGNRGGGQPPAKGEDRIGEKLNQDGNNSNLGRTSSKKALKLRLTDAPGGPLKAALDEIDESFPTNPMNSKENMVLVNDVPVAVFEVAGRNGKLRLKDIRSLEKGQGGGRAALQAVTAIADKHGVEMELTASPFGDEKTRLDKDQLQDWYRRHNFEDEPDKDPALGYMVRKPKQADTAQELNRSGIKSVGFMQAVMRAGDTFIPTGTCDRCGTGIKNVFVVTYRDGSVQNYGSECINKILSNAPDMKSLFAKNAKKLKKYQDYLTILSEPAEAMPRGSEYYGSGLYFIADSEGKDISFGHWFFHPIFDEEKNADHQRHVVKSEWIARCEKEIQHDIPKLKAEITRLETFLGKVLFKGMMTPPEPKKEAKKASNVISGEQVVDYVLKQHPGWDRQQAYQIVGLDAGGDYILTDEYDLDKLEAGDDYDPALAERYAKMKTPLPPIILDMDGKIRDGNHRVAAAKLRGDNYIAAYEPLDTYDPSEAA